MSVVINQVEPNVYYVNSKPIYVDSIGTALLIKDFTAAEINALSNFINSKNQNDE